MIINFILLGCVFFSITSANAAPFKGRLIEKGTKNPIDGASIFLLPAKLKATTEPNGSFEFSDVPADTSQIVVNVSGYQKLEEAFDGAAATDAVTILYLEREAYIDEAAIYTTTITDKAVRHDDSKRTLTAKQATALPGSGNDAIRAIQNLPGVARVPGLSSQIVIQGSAPQDTRYLIDGHEVPIIFHFGGFTSVVQPEALDRIDYLSAGYGPEFGRAQGGLIGAWTKKPDTTRTRGFAFADLLNAGGAIETPLDDKSSLYFGLRKSYIGFVLKAAIKDDEDAAFTAAPAFDDASLIYQRKLNDRQDLKITTIGSRDTLEFLLKKPVDGDPTLRGDFYNRTAFVRVLPQWSIVHTDGSKTNASFGLGRDWVKFVLGTDYFDLQSRSLTTRAEHERDFSSTWKWVLGTDNRLSTTNLSLRLPNYYEKGDISNPLSSGEVRELRIRDISANTFGLYTQGIYTGFERFTLRPGARLDYFQTTKELFVAPRLSARYTLTDTLALRGAGGMYYQPASPQESSKEAGNPEIHSPRALHLALGAEKDFRDSLKDGFTVTSGPFYRKFDQLVIASPNLVNRAGTITPERFNNSGEGKSFGLEVFIQGILDAGSQKAATATLSYTLSRSTRRDPFAGRYLSGYDQTHNLNLILAKELLKNWKLSSRFRYVSGNPLTPVSGSVFDTDNGSFIPIRGPIYSSRTTPFWQLDLRIDKRWVYKTWILSAYFDFQNVTNRRNVENVQYSYDYRQREDIKGLPFLPILGVKGEF